MTEEYKTQLEALESENTELRKMINEGVTFDVNVTYRRRKPGFWGFFRRRERVTEKRSFTIEEPTLNTLDRLSALWLKMSIDETKLGNNDYLTTAKHMVAQETRTLAEIVAVAVMGEDYYDVKQQGDRYKRTERKDELKRVTSFFFHTVKPSELFTLAVLITNVSNLGDFINSIRLMSATRTSDPTHLIEPQD